MMEHYSPRSDVQSSTKPLGALSSYGAFRTPLAKTVAGSSLAQQHFSYKQLAARKKLSYPYVLHGHPPPPEPQLQPDAFMREHMLEYAMDPENQYDFVLLPGTINARPGMKILAREEVDPTTLQDAGVSSPKDKLFEPPQALYTGPPAQPTPSPPPSSSNDALNVNFTNFCRYGASCFRKNCRFRHDGGSMGSPSKSLSPNANGSDARAKTPPNDSLSLASSDLSESSTPSSLSPRDE